MGNLLRALCAPTAGVRALWTGNDGWLLWDGQHLIATDLDLIGGCTRLQPPPVDVHELAKALRLLFISHEHGDHFCRETCRVLLNEGECLFVVPESCVQAARELGIPQGRMRIVRPGVQFAAAGAQVACIRALHGHLLGTVYQGANMADCGYRFTFGGLCFYQPGDTVLLHEHLEMSGIDVLFVSPTEHNTWIENSKRMIESIVPRITLAQHFGTYDMPAENDFWTRGYTQELRAALSPSSAEGLIIPNQQDILTLV